MITQVIFSYPFPDPVKEAIGTSVFQVGLSFLMGCLSIYSNRQCFFHNLYLVVRAMSRCTKVLANLRIHYCFCIDEQEDIILIDCEARGLRGL